MKPSIGSEICSVKEIVRFYDNGAENGTRTRDPHLGKVMLYH